MKKIVICLLGLVLFLLSTTAFATNWVLLKQYHLTGAKVYEYIDSDSVVQNGDSLFYWKVQNVVWPKRVDAFMSKIEVTLTDPRQYRELESYRYKNGQPFGQNMKPTRFSIASKIKEDIDMALQYAKEGQDAGQIPDISQIPQN
jgi:hypothetical protein